MAFLFLYSHCVPVQRAVNDSPNLLPKRSLACCLSVWFLITLLVLSHGPTPVEWVTVETTQSGITTVYVEPDSVRRTEQMVKMWHMIDFKTVQPYRGHAVENRMIERHTQVRLQHYVRRLAQERATVVS